MQAIVTKYLGPTNTRGSRIVARCDAGRLVVSWDGDKGVEDNHAAAAVTLCRKLGWTKANGHPDHIVGGSLPDADRYCWVPTRGRGGLSWRIGKGL